MARSLHEILRKLADEIESDEKAEHEDAQRRKLEELEARAFSEDDRAALDRIKKLVAELDEDDAKDEDEKEDDEGEDDDELEARRLKRKAKRKAKPAEDEDEDEKPAPKTRPGRKRGAAYDWDVDEDGEVRRLDVARIYDGDDEPDTVELKQAAGE